MQFDHIVSLGGRCQVAHQIRRHYGFDRAQVFDWLITPFDGLLQVLESDFATFAAADAWSVAPSNQTWYDHKHMIHRCGAVSPHELDQKGELAEQMPQFVEKLAFLIHRWRMALEKSHRTLFVRQQTNEPICGVIEPLLTQDDARRLRALIKAGRPDRDDQILIIADQAAANDDWTLDGVIARAIQQTNGADWRGDDQAWERALDGFRLAAA